MQTSGDEAYQVLVFAPAGYGQALRVVEKDDWKGHALLIKRAIFPEAASRTELQRPGVYILHGPSAEDESRISLYIGEGDPTFPRLKSHYKLKDFWTDIICFTSVGNLLTKSHIQYLESRLINMALQAKRCHVENVRIEVLPTLSEAQIALCERFLKHMLDCLSVLGIRFFENPKTLEATELSEKLSVYIITKDIGAKGFESPNGFVVEKGSSASASTTESFGNSAGLTKLRERLIEDGILSVQGNLLEFVADFEFGSPSTAASIVYGRVMNGREAWKLADGTSLKIAQDRRVAGISTEVY
jgi:hypothetical protein